jgi:hypothetical protein
MAINTLQARSFFWVLLGLLPLFGWSEEVPAATGVTQIGPGVSVDVKKQEVYLDAAVCKRIGILEYIICAKHTFEHEAVFAAEGKASHLHLGLLLIAREPYAYAPAPDWPEMAQQHPTSHLAISVEYDEQGVLQRKRLSQFARNREREDGVVADRWIFSGSVFYEREGKEYYAADSAGGIIGLMYKGASVVQYGENIGVPYQGENLGLECNTDAIPPAGTAVRVVFSRVLAPAAVPPAPATPAATTEPAAPATNAPDQPSSNVDKPSAK